jgi:tripartite-type tricarboxylate transporter receptor subunit TctC
MSTKLRPIRAASAIIVAFLSPGAAALAPVAAQSPEAFFKDKTIKVMVGHAPGGGFDAYARLGADMLKKHLPGVSAVIVENKPGGGGLVASAHFYAQAARDGTQMAVFPEQLAGNQILQPKVAQWRMEEMRYVGAFTPVNSGLLLRKGAAAKTVEDMRTIESTVGCDGVNSQGYQYPSMLKNLGGFKFKMVCGYRGSPEYLLALEKGEVDIASNAWSALRITHWGKIKSGDVTLFAQGGLKRNPEIPDTPLLQELVADAEGKAAIELASAGAAIGRALLLPPGVPAERVSYLRMVFDRMVKDPEMVALAASRQLVLEPVAGAELDGIVTRILSSPKSLVDKAAEAMK